MLENIIICCNYVSKNSKHVTIDEEKLNHFVENIKDIKMNEVADIAKHQTIKEVA